MDRGVDVSSSAHNPTRLRHRNPADGEISKEAAR